MSIKKSDLYSSTWANCDQLRGGMDTSQYKSYMLFVLHKAKQRIPEDRWRKTLGWMREKGFVPHGVSLP